MERHFLRVPAAYAAELSAIDREKWLKQTRRLPGTTLQSKDEAYLRLPAETLPAGKLSAGVAVLAGEVRFFPLSEGSRQGAVVLHWLPSPAAPGQGSSRLWLLKTEGGRYIPQPLTRWLPAASVEQRYSLTDVPGAIVVYHRTSGGGWRKAAVLRWQQGQWALD